MTTANFVKNICKKLGESPKATYSMVAIAAANGIFRPTFTMMKKGENPESKKYAALREGLTEAFAVPIYWVTGELAAKCGKSIVAKAMDKKFEKLEKAGKTYADNVKQEMKSAMIKKGESGLRLIGVCLAAGVIIPALCSVCVKPVMNKLKPQNNNNKLDIKENTVTQPQTVLPVQQINRPVFKNVSYSGMKVGGV